MKRLEVEFLDIISFVKISNTYFEKFEKVMIRSPT